MTSQPHQAELTRAVRHEAGPRAQRELARQPLYLVQHDRRTKTATLLRQGASTQDLQVSVDRRNQASTAPHHDRGLPLILTKLQAQVLEARYRETITRSIRNHLALLLDPQEPVDNPVVSGAIDRETRRIARELLEHRPIGTVHKNAMRDLLGRDQFNHTLRIAGATAALREHSIIHWNPRTMEEAHRQNPNATLVWILTSTLEPIIQYCLPEPDRIIQEARGLVERLAGSMREFHERQEVFQYLSDLHSQAINRLPEMDAWTATMLAALAQRAQVQPTFHAVTAIETQDLHDTHTQRIIPSYFQEDHRLRDAPAHLRRRLDAQYRSLRPSNLSQQTSTAIRDMAQQQGEKVIPWKYLTRLSQPRGHTRHPQGSRLPQPAAHERDVRDFIKGLDPHQASHLRKTLEDCLQVSHRPGREVIVRTANHPEPALHLFRETNGQVHARAGHHWTGVLNMPPAWTTDHPEAWTTRGLWAQTAGQTAANWVREHWAGDRRLPRQQALSRMALGSIMHRMVETEEEKSAQLRQAVRTLFDPRTIDRARRATEGENVTLAQYNVATLGDQAIDDLAQNNPGALAWAMLRSPPEAQVNHPGQLVQAARKELQRTGMDPAHWRVARRLSIQSMRKVLGLADWARVQTITLLALARVTPDDRAVTLAAQMARHLSDQNLRGPRVANLARFLQLHQDTEEPDPNRQDCLDYVIHLSDTGSTLTSRTRNGLRKRTERWHREMNQRQLRHQWEATMSERDGWLHAWNSLLPQTQVDGITCIPLTDEEQLFQESVRMAHCVFSYGPRAAQGQSRLFTLERDGRPVATLEITPDGDGWAASQMRAYRNHPVDPRVQQAGEQLAQRYSQAWREKPNHHTRKVRRQTGIPRPPPGPGPGPEPGMDAGREPPLE